MATTDIRTRLRQIALKVESTPGTDAIAGTPAAGDYVTCEATIRFSQDTVPNPVVTGAYDDAVPIPGALRAEISVAVPIVGSGAAGTAPEWGKLLTAAGMIETVTSSAVGVPTAAASGTATTVTAASPFGTTAQQYRGMPVLLAGNPAAGAIDVITNYTTGRAMTLAGGSAGTAGYSSALSSSTTLQIPVNVLYGPTSDDSLEKWLTIYSFADDLRYIVTGAKATGMSIALRDGGYAMLNMTFTGQVVSRNQAVSRPAGYTPVTRQPPLWRAGMSRLNNSLAACAAAGWDMGIRGAYLENPEAANGYDPAIMTGRSPRITIDPFAHSTNSPLRSGAMDAQSAWPYAAIWGSSAGNRFSLMCPSAVILDMNMGDRNGLGTDQIILAPNLIDAGWFLSCF
jgi:hypothetical protein